MSPASDEDAGGGADGRALGEPGDLLGHLGLGELDLLADEQRGLLGDLLDRLARALMSVWSGHRQSTSLLRMRAARNAPAKRRRRAPPAARAALGPAARGRRRGRGPPAARRPRRPVVRAEARGPSRSRPKGRGRSAAGVGSAPQAFGRGGLLARLAPPRPRPARRASRALRSLRESFSSFFSASSTASCAFASPLRRAARRSRRARRAARRRGPRPARARPGPRPRARRRPPSPHRPWSLRPARRSVRDRRRQPAGSHSCVRWGSSLSLRRIFPKDAAENHSGDARRHDRGQGPDAGEQAGPGQALDEIVVHGGGVYAARPPQMVSTTCALACS